MRIVTRGHANEHRREGDRPEEDPFFLAEEVVAEEAPAEELEAEGAGAGRESLEADGAQPTGKEGPFQVRLEHFEGPLDLLLYLIRKNEIDIYDIPIAEITEEYLQYLNLMKLLNLELAGEFLLMAATLVRIKARMLVPREPSLEEEEELEDPREELGRLLQEHLHFQKLGGELGEFAEREGYYFARGGEAPRPGEEEPEYREATLFDLLAAFHRALGRAPEPGSLLVTREEVTLEEMMEEIRQRLVDGGPCCFWNLIRPGATRSELVVQFLALLELSRQGHLRMQQVLPFGDIWLSWCALS